MINEVNDSKFSLKAKFSLDSDPTAPLAVLVHGRAGNFDLMWTFKRCLPQQNISILTPQAFLDDPIGGHSWWLIEPKRDYRTDIELASSQIKNFIQEFITEHQLKPRSIHAFGFSQGAVLLSYLLLKEPLLFDSIAFLAGFIIQNPDLKIDLNKIKTRIFIAHGTQDRVVNIEKAREGRDYLLALGFDVKYVEDPVAHKIGTSAMRELKSWMEHV